MFRNILVAVDGSRHSDRALGEAIDLATAGSGRLTILSAVPRPPSWSVSPMALATVQTLHDELERDTRRVLGEAVDRVPDTIPVTKLLTHAPIRQALHEQLHSGRYDVLVMGSRGRGAVTASLLGSVSHYALHHSPIPVLVTHAEADADADVSPSGDQLVEQVG